MTKMKQFFLLMLITLLLSACRSEEAGGCDGPPRDGFKESDLIGTWGGTLETVWDSIIIIRNDGKYRQSIDIKRTDFRYDSDWQDWQITYSEKGLPYLHLKGLLMCAYWSDLKCDQKNALETVQAGDTKDPMANETYWYDGCKKEWIDTPGEGVFMVLDGGKAPRGIALVPFSKSSHGVTGPWYELQ